MYLTLFINNSFMNAYIYLILFKMKFFYYNLNIFIIPLLVTSKTITATLESLI